jgi:hypothetical protein
MNTDKRRRGDGTGALSEDERAERRENAELAMERDVLRHPHQVRVVQLVIAAVQPPPPAPEPARVVPKAEVGLQHDPVYAVIAAGQ